MSEEIQDRLEESCFRLVGHVDGEGIRVEKQTYNGEYIAGELLVPTVGEAKHVPESKEARECLLLGQALSVWFVQD